MRLDQLAPLGLGILAAGMVIGGLVVVGGPEAARREKRDEARIVALSELADCLILEPEARYETLPAVMSKDSPCADRAPWQDPDTKEPFRIAAKERDYIKVCATFESAAPPRRSFYKKHFDPATGCLRTDRSD